MRNIKVAYHEREYDGGGLDALDEPHDHRADGLYGGEDVHEVCLDVAQVDVVGLVLGRHQHQQHPLDKLTTRNRQNMHRTFFFSDIYDFNHFWKTYS